MTSPKPTRHLMSSPPVSNSARFRSPGIVRRNILGDPGFQSAQFAKKSRRSKSTDANNRDASSNVLAGKRKLQKSNEGDVEDHLETLNSRWRLMAKNQEKMTKEEVMTNYKLLLTDHIKLEKFMSLISRENELTRTRLESDLLDSMMLVEDLKQSLERSKSDPRDAMERRELLKQNKKLIVELHESAKKNEMLDLIIFDLKDQVELADFQMMEIQNQKTIMEEQFEIQRLSHSVSSQTTGIDDLQMMATFARERDSMRDILNDTNGEIKRLLIVMKSVQDDNDVLKISEENLQEELVIKSNKIKSLMKDIGVLEDRIKNSMDDSPPSVEHVLVTGPRSVDDDTVAYGFDDFDELSNATDSGFEITENNVNGMSGDLFTDTIKMLWDMAKEKDEEIVRLTRECRQSVEAPTFYKSSLHDELDEARKFPASSYKHCQSYQTNDRRQLGERPGRHSPVGACCSSVYKLQLLEKENRRWKCFVENIGISENELLTVIADLEETLRTYKVEPSAKIETKYKGTSQKAVDSSQSDRSADYFNRQLDDIHHGHCEDQLKVLLLEADRSKEEEKRKCLRLEEELDASNIYIEKLDSELTTTKKIELTLRRRIETLEQRLMSTNKSCSVGPSRSVLELETKMAQLETVNSSLIEVNSLEKKRMEEQRTSIRDLEHSNRALNEKLSTLQTKELHAQKKITRLQEIYEDLLREYAAIHVPSSERSKESKTVAFATACDENKRLKVQLKGLKEKNDELQSLVVRYQRHLFTDGKLSNYHMNRSFNSQYRNFETKLHEFSKVTKRTK